ncbi:acyltransferase [Streptomyces sp. NPDC048491]
MTIPPPIAPPRAAATSPRSIFIRRTGRASSIAPPGLPGRLDSLTSLRFFAAFAVFAHHFTGLGGKTGLGRAPAIFPYSQLGAHGVTFFFVLSGFLLTWVFKPHEHPIAFYWRRAARIWPAVLVSAILAVYVFYVEARLTIDWPGVIASLFLVQNWFPHINPSLPGNPVTWTLSVEILFYALFPLLARIVVRLRTVHLAALSALGLVGMYAVNWWAATHTSTATAAWIMRHPVVYLPQFLLGMTFAVALQRGWRPRLHPAIPIGLLALYVYGYFHARLYLSKAGIAQLEYTLRPTLAVLAALLIVAFVQREVAGHRGVMNSKPLILLGTWSYCFYLLHHSISRWATYEWGRIPDNNSALFTMLGMGLVVTALSWVLHSLVEEPANRWLVRHIPARWRRVAPRAPR